MIRKFLALLLMAALTAGSLNILSCNRTSKPGSAEQAATADNSRNALDWAGTYRGIIPCADCEGIETTINLTYEGSYVLKTTYLGKDDQVFVEEGRFTWDKQGSVITLDGKIQSGARIYLVGENRIIQLDMQGKRITGPLADHYILEKQAN